MSAQDIDAELAQMADAGYRAAEVLCILSADPAHSGWGSPAMSERMQNALESAKNHGVEVDFTLGPAWPLVVPGLTPDSAGLEQELVHGSAVVAGGATFAGAVPEPTPAPAPGVTQQTLIAVQAVRCAASCTEAKPVQLVSASSIDLTAAVQSGQLTWTAPSGGPWILLSFWQRGTGQVAVVGAQGATVSSAYVVDHFSAEGAALVTRYWDSTILTPALRDLLRRAGGDVFVDSLELKANLSWTPMLADEFARRRGYALGRHLPVLFIAGLHQHGSGATPDSAPDYEFTDGSGPRVRNDYYQTLTDLYEESHLSALRSWAQSLGLKLRAQPYGPTIDMTEAALRLDVPETESWNFGDNVDEYRAIASAVHVAGKPLLSFECCAEYNAAYAQTWQAMLAHIQKGFVGGVNQVVVHGFATQHGLGLPWPGFSPFTVYGGNGFSEAWGPRQPMWKDMSQLTDWMARMQLILRQWQPRVDLAIFRQSYAEPGTIFADQALGASGYSYDFVDPAALLHPLALVGAGRLDSQGPAYRALILDNQASLPIEVARRILDDARAGLPVVVVGAAPSRTPGWAAAPADADAQLQALVAELLAEPKVARAATEAEVVPALGALGVRAAAEAATPSELRVVHRGGGDGDLYYVYNGGAAAQSTELQLEGAGRPFALDAWTGAVAPIALYRELDGARVAIPLTLAPGASTVVAILPSAQPPHAERHAVSTTDGEIVDRDGELVLRASHAGTFSVGLSDGKSADAAVSTVPAPMALTDWHLTVRDWSQGPDGNLVETSHELDLHGLLAWPDIPDLQDVSGIGSYSAQVDIGPGWSGGHGARLQLGEVIGTFAVAVNNHALPAVDQVTATVDVGRYLQPGPNTISVEVATTLRNRLRVTPGFSGQAAEPRQRVGLVGPVQLIPYGEVALSAE